jgi:hypothetical protein
LRASGCLAHNNCQFNRCSPSVTCTLPQVILSNEQLAEAAARLGYPPSFVKGALAYKHPVMQSLLSLAGYQLRMHQEGKITALTELFGQMSGLYLVEFFWRKGEEKGDHHVIAGLELPLREHMHPTSQTP